ncbi:amt [Symbiodinium sp. CCMP2592]|nr:amt [Symbiodinium sp. CCMP2592]
MTDAAVNILANMTQEADPPLTATEDAGAVAWVLTSTALVFLMTAGLGFFYGGLVRDTNIINTMMMSVVSMGIVTLTWVVFGFSWAFGDNGETGIGLFIGNFDYSFWTGLDMKNWDTLPGLAFASFQMTFAIIASAIISGSLVERVRFSAYCIMLALWSLLIYAPLCHWVWGPGGWIGQLGALDFAGGTVVHISSGVSGLVAGAILGPRKHVEKDLGPANAPFVILGGCLLWFGWLGFNGGSALSTTDGVAARAVATTFVAAASSMLTWLALERILKGKSTSVGASVGAVAGLVVITPAAGFVTPGWSIAIGALGAPWCYLTVEAVNRINLVDDTLDAFGLHGSGGFAGAILTGIFAVDEGLIYSGSFLLLGKQIAGALAGVAFSAVGTAIIVGVMRMLFKLRVPEDQEIGGVDQHTHGESYHSPIKRYEAGGRMTESSESESDAVC